MLYNKYILILHTHCTSLTFIVLGPETVTSEYVDVTRIAPVDCSTERVGTTRGSHGGTPYSGTPDEKTETLKFHAV